MPAVTGIDHLALTVTDLDVSERFYTEVLGIPVLVDFGAVRVLMHRPTGFMISLVRHDGAGGERFSELHTGADHIGFPAADRDELLAWEARFRAAGVEFTPVRDMPLGHHLNFRDPDGIALELTAPNETYSAYMRELRTRDVPRAEIRARLEEVLGQPLPALRASDG